jgi:type II secretion system protein N
MSLDYNADVDGPELEIHSASLTLRRGYASGGNLTASGSYNLDKKIAQLNFKVIDLNQNALDPILAPALEGQKLNSISLNGSGSANYDPGGQAALKTDLSVTNWVVSDPRRNFTSPNLSAQAQVEGVFQQNILDLKQVALQLPPTDKAPNNGFRLSGRFDFSPTNASPSQARLDSTSLDLTPYYDMFAGAPKNGPEAKPQPSNNTGPGPVSGAPRAEPAPAHLPLEQLTADAKCDRLFLREVAITNLQASAKINHGQVTLDPIQLSLNGAPVSAKAALNLAVQGYTYDFSMNAERVPLAPLANSFSTNSPNQKLGELVAQAQLKGAGITDLNLKKNLNGNLSLTLTNMSYDVLGPKVDRLLRPISVVLNVPELMQTPINWVSAKAQVGSGQLDLQQFRVQSQAFYAESHGTVPLADVLTNSPLNLPVNLSLRRSLSDKAHLTPANSPTNTDYAQLPSFVTLAGTLGNPKTEINKLVVGGLVMKTIGGIPGGQAGAILQGLGGLISGQKASTSGTNAPANTNSAANILQGVSSFVSGLGKRASTNAPANTNKTPAKPSILDLLK